MKRPRTEGPLLHASSTPPASIMEAVSTEPHLRPSRSAANPSASCPTMMPPTCDSHALTISNRCAQICATDLRQKQDSRVLSSYYGCHLCEVDGGEQGAAAFLVRVPALGELSLEQRLQITHLREITRF